MGEELGLEYKLITGFRQSSKLLFIEKEEQIYKYKSRKDHLKYYYCYKNDCKAGVSIEANNTKHCRRIGKNHMHNHGSQMELYKKLEIMNNIKMEVKNAAMKRGSIRDIFEENCKKFQDASHLLEYDKMRRQLFNIKKDQLPKSPINFEEIVNVFQNEKVYKQYGVSRYEKDSQPFYIDTTISGSFSYSLFVSPTISKYLPSLSSLGPINYIVDIISNIIPQLHIFKRLLVLSIMHEYHAYPFIYVLMSHSSEDAYAHLMQYLKTHVLDLNSSVVISDFDNNLREAVKTVFPTVKLVECWFHYINELRRKTIELPNFVDILNKDQHGAHLFNKFLYLPLLKSTDIITAYELLKEESNAYFTPFLKYYDFEWLQKIKPENFSVYQQPIRTNSFVGSFQSRLSMKTTKHPNLFKFLQVLCDFDRETSSNYVKSNEYLTRENTNENCFKIRNKFIQESLSHLEEEKISIRELLNRFSYSNEITISKHLLKNFNISNDESNFDNLGHMAHNRNNILNETNNSQNNMDKDDKSEIQKYLLCILCSDRERQLVYFPCRHFKVCRPCFEQISEKAKATNMKPICSSCRLEIHNVLPIFC